MTTDLEIYQYACRWRPYLRKQVGEQDAEDLLHEWFLVLLSAQRHGRIRVNVQQYAWGTLRRLIYRRWNERQLQNEKTVQLDEAIVVGGSLPDPEHRLLSKERTHIACRTFHGLKPKQREVLIRFYLQEEPRESIERAMFLSTTQFRLLKSRAKAAYTERGKAQMFQSTGGARCLNKQS